MESQVAHPNTDTPAPGASSNPRHRRRPNRSAQPKDGETSLPPKPRQQRPKPAAAANDPGTSTAPSDTRRSRPRGNKPNPTAEGSAPRPRNPRAANFGAGLTQPKEETADAPHPQPKAKGRRLPQGDDLTSSLIRQMSTPPYPDCPICFSETRPEQAIWSCSPSIPIVTSSEAQVAQYCWTSFHIKCIRSWADKSVKEIAEAYRARGETDKKGDWRCPGCQAKREIVPSGYWCFCNSISEPKPFRLSTPHSCGNSCSRSLPASRVTVQNRTFSLSTAVYTPEARPYAICLAVSRARGPLIVESTSAPKSVTQESAVTAKCRNWRSVGAGKTRRRSFAAKGTRYNASWKASNRGLADMNLSIVVLIVAKSHVIRRLRNLPYAPVHRRKSPLVHVASPVSHHLPILMLRITHSQRARTAPTASQPKCHEGPCPPCHVEITRPCRCGATTKRLHCFQVHAADAAGAEEKEILCDKPCLAYRACGHHQCRRQCCPLASMALSAGKKGKRRAVAGLEEGIGEERGGLHECDLEFLRGADLPMWKDCIRATDSLWNENAVPLSLRTTTGRMRTPTNASFLP
ncbi:hypothetical protein D9619_011330 [Psilocybe cf. subviscida]|uniref:RING-type domain-containing protein n=1 Tax=Psilocybe cf. subviscida TaxID=2480587 RepID=A0A8H5BKT5_9AGAR|nr:hypothetical protein D9619_011330 [Psilocybe cf. subviscida]